jgi:hypothetical protein
LTNKIAIEKIELKIIRILPATNISSVLINEITARNALFIPKIIFDDIVNALFELSLGFISEKGIKYIDINIKATNVRYLKIDGIKFSVVKKIRIHRRHIVTIIPR